MPRYKELSTSKTERIRIIMDMMARCEWVRGATGKKLAKQWGCSLATVASDASEASRLLLRDVEDAGEIRATLLKTLGTAVRVLEQLVDNPSGSSREHIMAIRDQTVAITEFCRVYATMPEEQEATVVPEAIDQLASIMRARGYAITKIEGKSNGTDAKQEQPQPHQAAAASSAETEGACEEAGCG